MASKDYTNIRKATDTQNFQYVALNTNQGKPYLNWNDTYDLLITGNLSAVLQYPPITPSQEGYCGYNRNGLGYALYINASNVEYDVGTSSGNSVDGTMQAYLNGTVFAFESVTGSNWLWRAIITNNSSCY